ncbi:hypothetical protein BJF90_33515 [Pseudonocardia sp. CNS-004]|nr:hypothetical protein BJF90_33515 [Pseudonocardia sp. CNS-004]
MAAQGREAAGRPGGRRRAGAVTHACPTRRGRGRILGVDAARAVALVGMFATHIFPLREAREPTLTGLVAAGRASALFAVLAGVGIALATGGRDGPGTPGSISPRAPRWWCAARWWRRSGSRWWGSPRRSR